MGKRRERFADWVKSLSTKQKWLIAVAGVLVAIAILYQFYWSGFGEDSNKSVTTKQVINPKDGKTIELKETTEHFQSGKTVWDWLGLAGTIAIPVVLFQFQRSEQRRAEERAKGEQQRAEERAKGEQQRAEERAALEREIAATNLRESALEAYIDRMSELLIDKELKVLIGKEIEESNPEYQKRDAALDIVRARTLSVLRRLDRDGERKGSVVRFLIDAELISKLNLSGANLSGANLSGANLIGADLSDADLSSAYLESARLSGAILESAYLIDAILGDANLSGANLRLAILSSASLIGADLESAILSGAILIGANLTDADLSSANLSGADLTGANLGEAILDEGTILP
ncbi:pentapeptide repeat-containing protein, partial [Scytonema sp. UIC 10036]|uniref:pentapeptide repeat-containing protein n=1 Tax=Scytonema sp. UIC 10036 TaxID=2304196 RepID=UPI0012DA1FB9